MNPSRTARVLAPVAAVVLIVSACSSSSTKGAGAGVPSNGSGTPSTGTAGSPSTSSTPPAATAPTKAQLTKIVVQQGDLPAGYVGKPAEADNDNDASLNAQLTSCTGLKASPDGDKVATASSDDFTKGELTISSDATSYKSKSDVDMDVALLKSPKINSCLNQVLKAELTKQVPAGTKLDSFDLKLTPGSSGGPSNVAGLASGQVTITANGTTATLYLGIAFITGPLLEVTLEFLGIGAPLDQTTQTTVLAAVAKRAANP